MVEIVSGSGIDRILSKNEVQEDLATRLNRQRAVEARDTRIEIRSAALARGLEAEASAQVGNQGIDADLGSETAIRQPRFADLVGNAETVNRALEETQGVDRLVTAGERLRQSAVLTDSFLKSYFISMVDPGRAMTMISPRDIARPLEEDG